MDTTTTHTARCLAHALICAVENLRDMEDQTGYGFRLAVQENTPLQWADDYLISGTATCLCPSEEAK